MRSPDWPEIHAFLEVARSGSLSGAARVLRVTQPTVRRHIAALGDKLKVELFRRSPGGMVLTKDGQRLLPAAEAMEKAAAEFSLRAEGRSAEVSGTVRLTASHMVSHYLLPPMLADLRRHHPAIQIELVPSDATENLLYREADLAIRMYRPQQDDLIVRKVAAMRLALYAAPELLERTGRPASFDEAMTLEMVGFDRDDLIIRYLAQVGVNVTRDFFPVRCDLQPVHWEMVRAGCGFGAAMMAIAEGDSRVERIVADYELPPLDVWLATPAEVRRVPRVALVWDFLARAFASLPGRAAA